MDKKKYAVIDINRTVPHFQSTHNQKTGQYSSLKSVPAQESMSLAFKGQQ